MGECGWSWDAPGEIVIQGTAEEVYMDNVRIMPIPVNTFVSEIRGSMRTEPTLRVLSQPPVQSAIPSMLPSN
jgi:hypothetical protein